MCNSYIWQILIYCFDYLLTCFPVILSESSIDCTRGDGGDSMWDQKALTERM